jgi:hypothetical protein
MLRVTVLGLVLSLSLSLVVRAGDPPAKDEGKTDGPMEAGALQLPVPKSDTPTAKGYDE